MEQIREVHEVPVPVETRRHSVMAPFLMFVVGALLIALVAIFVFDIHWTVSWPAGRVDIGLKPIAQTAQQ